MSKEDKRRYNQHPQSIVAKVLLFLICVLANTTKTLLLFIIRGYRYFISPLLGNNCRFYPSCSIYMQTAIVRFGVIKGIWLGLKRLIHCHPWHPGGVDLLPPPPK